MIQLIIYWFSFVVEKCFLYFFYAFNQNYEKAIEPFLLTFKFLIYIDIYIYTSLLSLMLLL